MSNNLKRKLNARRTRRRILGLLGAGAVGVGGLYWFTGRATVVETSDVEFRTGQFHPRNITVSTGTEVTWENTEQYGHNVASVSDNWDFAEAVDPDSRVSYTFEESGVYEAECNVHNGERMKIAVGDATIDEPLGGWF